MPNNLVIVESPAKAKTIEKFLGKDYKVMSSYGHIRDLKKKSFSIDPETFQPQYEVPSDKTHIVSQLKQGVKAADMVWLASDRGHLMASAGSVASETRTHPTHRLP